MTVFDHRCISKVFIQTTIILVKSKKDQYKGKTKDVIA